MALSETKAKDLANIAPPPSMERNMLFLESLLPTLIEGILPTYSTIQFAVRVMERNEAFVEVMTAGFKDQGMTVFDFQDFVRWLRTWYQKAVETEVLKKLEPPEPPQHDVPNAFKYRAETAAVIAAENALRSRTPAPSSGSSSDSATALDGGDAQTTRPPSKARGGITQAEESIPDDGSKATEPRRRDGSFVRGVWQGNAVLGIASAGMAFTQQGGAAQAADQGIAAQMMRQPSYQPPILQSVPQFSPYQSITTRSAQSALDTFMQPQTLPTTDQILVTQQPEIAQAMSQTPVQQMMPTPPDDAMDTAMANLQQTQQVPVTPTPASDQQTYPDQPAQADAPTPADLQQVQERSQNNAPLMQALARVLPHNFAQLLGLSPNLNSAAGPNGAAIIGQAINATGGFLLQRVFGSRAPKVDIAGQLLHVGGQSQGGMQGALPMVSGQSMFASQILDPLSTISPQTPLNQITLIAPPMTVASAAAERSGSMVQMNWQDIAPGISQLNSSNLGALVQNLPPGVLAIYPALANPGAAGPNAINLPLAPELVSQLVTNGYGTGAVQAVQQRLSAPFVRPVSSRSAVLNAQIVPTANAPIGGVTSLFGGNKGALGTAGGGQARTTPVLNFLGLPVRLAPSLGGRSELTEEVALRSGATTSPSGSPIRESNFQSLQRALFPGFSSVHAEPDAGAWRQAAPSFGLRSGDPVTVLSPDSKIKAPVAHSGSHSPMSLGHHARPLGSFFGGRQGAGLHHTSPLHTEASKGVTPSLPNLHHGSSHHHTPTQSMGPASHPDTVLKPHLFEPNDRVQHLPHLSDPSGVGHHGIRSEATEAGPAGRLDIPRKVERPRLFEPNDRSHTPSIKSGGIERPISPISNKLHIGQGHGPQIGHNVARPTSKFGTRHSGKNPSIAVSHVVQSPRDGQGQHHGREHTVAHHFPPVQEHLAHHPLHVHQIGLNVPNDIPIHMPRVAKQEMPTLPPRKTAPKTQSSSVIQASHHENQTSSHSNIHQHSKSHQNEHAHHNNQRSKAAHIQLMANEVWSILRRKMHHDAQRSGRW